MSNPGMLNVQLFIRIQKLMSALRKRSGDSLEKAGLFVHIPFQKIANQSRHAPVIENTNSLTVSTNKYPP